MSLQVRRILSTGLIALFISLLPLASPIQTLAASSNESSSECTLPPANDPRSRGPSGSASATFHYNCASGMWENGHFIYDPISNVTTPKDTPVYTYNTSSGQWDYVSWVYNAPSGKYVARTASVSQPPAGAQIVGGPAPASVTPPPSTPQAPTSSSHTSSTATSSTAVAVANDITATATSGNASVYGNTTAANATTGSATATANIMNLLQSSGSLNGGQIATFTQNIDGDVTGDILLDPAKLSQIQPASNEASLSGDLQINQDTGASIHNTVTLAAASGDSSVSRNTTAGNATSGNATAVANIINMINTVISSGKSFVGAININGNLNGDILLPPGFIDQLLASDVPTTTINASQIAGDSQAVAAITNNQAISNNVTANAASGNATVAQNTTAGNATTGNANSNITVFNLTGSQIIGRNSILVFVNVLGKWVGMIVNASSGTTAAQLGGGITGNQTSNTQVNTTNNATIDNDVRVSAQSGDASVTENTTAGDATSGAAKAAVNLLNVVNGSMSLSDWFGILFINVFGSWNGSFGIDTAAGNPAIPSESSGSSPAGVQVFRFVTKTSSPPQTFQVSAPTSESPSTTISNSDENQQPPVVLASTTTHTPPKATAQLQKENSQWLISALGSGLLGAAFLGAERVTKRRQKAPKSAIQHTA